AHMPQLSPADPARAGLGPDRGHPLRGGFEHLVHIGAPMFLVPGLGEPCYDPLARDGVPQEHHAPILQAGEAVAAVHRGAGHQFTQGAGLGSSFGWHQSMVSGSAEASCQGTEAITTPGRCNSRALSRMVLRLCRMRSHQRPTTYSGT